MTQRNVCRSPRLLSATNLALKGEACPRVDVLTWTPGLR